MARHAGKGRSLRLRLWPRTRFLIVAGQKRQTLHQARQGHHEPTVLIRKSLGARVGCHLALEEKVTALICLGYPLCGGGDPASKSLFIDAT